MQNDMRSAVERRNGLKSAPGDLGRLQAFVNTLDVQKDRDELESLAALAAWLQSRGLLAEGVDLDSGDLERAVSVRNGLRTFVAERGRASREVREALERALAPAVLRVRFPASGRLSLEPAAGGLDAAFARLVRIAFAAQGADQLLRIKICASETCRAAFYDTSSNRSRKWCDVRCGNKYSARVFRRRERRRERVRRRSA